MAYNDTVTKKMINLRSKLHRALFGYYFGHPNEERYLRELSRLLSFDVAYLSRELNQLVRQDLFCARRIGREKFFRINSKHRLFKELRKIVVDAKSQTKP